MERLEVIQKIINKTNCKTYLEIGVRYGTVFLKIKAPKKIGVDPNFRVSFFKKILFFKDVFKNKSFKKTSDAFFVKDSAVLKKDGIDVVFIDGMHTYEQSLKDVKNCLKYLNEGGVIIMHDCNPTTGPMAEESFEVFEKTPNSGKAWCGNVWKTIVHLRSIYSDLNVFVLDCDYGLGVITKGNQKNMLKYSIDEIEKMSYEDMSKDRENILNLKNPDYLYEFMSKLQ